VENGHDADAATEQIAAGKGIGKVSDDSQNGCIFGQSGRKIGKLALTVCLRCLLSSEDGINQERTSGFEGLKANPNPDPWRIGLVHKYFKLEHGELTD
jgi:hypothetical protein